MSDANKALVRRWFNEVWNQGREETIDELFAANGIGYGLGDTDAPLHGPAGFKPFVRNLRGALPDIHMAIDEGTHKGSQLGVAPSGKRVRIAGIVIVRIANGQIVEGWNSWDQLGLLRQIGALPAAGGPDRFTSARA